MSVQDLVTKSHVWGWLFDFHVDGHTLKPDHKIWIDRHVVSRLKAQSGNVSWKLWVVGSASRTASFEYNLSLGDKRAKAVQSYIAPKIAGSKSAAAMKLDSWSETPAMVRGRADEVENAFDRAVLIVMQQVTPQIKPPPPPPVPTPTPKKKVRRLTQFFQVEIFNLNTTGTWNVFVGEKYEMIDAELDYAYVAASIHPTKGTKGKVHEGTVRYSLVPLMNVNRYTLSWRKKTSADRRRDAVDALVPLITGLLGEPTSIDRRGVPQNDGSNKIYPSWADFKKKTKDLSEYNDFKVKYGTARYGAH